MRYMRGLGASAAYAKLLVHNETARHGLLRLARGRYTFVRNEAAVGFAFSPFYYGLEYALTIHRLWTQMANPVVITATKALPGTRRIMGSAVTIRRIAKRMFFGVEYVRFGGLFVPVSCKEKTLVDFLYYGLHVDAETARRLLEASDLRLLAKYARMAGRRVVIRLAALDPS